MKDYVALTRCYFCGEADRILLATRYHRVGNDMEPIHDLKPFHDKVMDMEPCTKCAGFMKQGIILMTIDPDLSEKDWNKQPIPNPYRAGGFFVVTEEAIRRMLQKNKVMLDWCLKHRWMFIEHKAAKLAGLYDHITER